MNRSRPLPETTPLLKTPYKVKRSSTKRLFDIAFSSCVLICGLPVFLAIIIAIRLTSKGPAIYKQERIGRKGVPFFCYKFRSMYADADSRLREILASDPSRDEEWHQLRKLKNDPRITPLGAFLRRTSLDEIPQFWNVLKGDLSIVGPRPVVAEEIHLYFGPKAHKILSVRPGLTGLWQVSGRNDIDYNQRIALDEQYIDRRTFWLDLKLIAKTIPCMCMRKGAY